MKTEIAEMGNKLRHANENFIQLEDSLSAANDKITHLSEVGTNSGITHYTAALLFHHGHESGLLEHDICSHISWTFLTLTVLFKQVQDRGTLL